MSTETTMDKEPDSTVEDAADAPVPDDGRVMLCIRDASGWLPPPPELQPVFAEWFAEMARRSLTAPRTRTLSESDDEAEAGR
jgi:hypothetical protein